MWVGPHDAAVPQDHCLEFSCCGGKALDSNFPEQCCVAMGGQLPAARCIFLSYWLGGRPAVHRIRARQNKLGGGCADSAIGSSSSSSGGGGSEEAAAATATAAVTSHSDGCSFAASLTMMMQGGAAIVCISICCACVFQWLCDGRSSQPCLRLAAVMT
jgi:hypothetical protein